MRRINAAANGTGAAPTLAPDNHNVKEHLSWS